MGPEADPSEDDFTARARIRDAALASFAARGFAGATIREIARNAKVSSGLVRHHFGSKADLRAACDDYALARIIEIKERAIGGGEVADVGFLTATHPTVLLLYRYFARSLVDGSQAAADLFQRMVGLCGSWLDRYHEGEFDDPRAFSAYLIAMEVGALSLQAELSHALGADVLSRDGHLRLTRARIDFYSRPLLSEEIAAQARAAISAFSTPGGDAFAPDRESSVR
jgi:AcrR family transcriptional regulator